MALGLPRVLRQPMGLGARQLLFLNGNYKKSKFTSSNGMSEHYQIFPIVQKDLQKTVNA